MAYPRVYLHEGTGQQKSCLCSLVDYGQRAARRQKAHCFASLEEYVDWCYAQPVSWDFGDGPTVPGCDPVQRSQVWPHGGLNCWEATAHYLAVALALCARVEVHLYDAMVKGQRHVFPGIRQLGEGGKPTAVVLQPPLKPRAQAWYNDLLGGLHVAGRTALDVVGTVYGGPAGGQAGDKLADVLEGVEDSSLPDWAKKNRGGAVAQTADAATKTGVAVGKTVVAMKMTAQAKKKTAAAKQVAEENGDDEDDTPAVAKLKQKQAAEDMSDE